MPSVADKMSVLAQDGQTLVNHETKVLDGIHTLQVQELTAPGTVSSDTQFLLLNHASTVIAATLSAPVVAGQVLVILNTSASGTAAHTATLPSGVTWDGTNPIATLNAPGEMIRCIALSTTRYLVETNTGSVAFSGGS